MLTNSERKMAELGALIKLKVSQQKYEEAEKLSAELLAVAESEDTTGAVQTTLDKEPAAAVLGALAVSAADEQIFRDNEHLKLLSLFHTIIGIGTALVSSMFLFHVCMGVAMLTNPSFFGTGGAPPREAGWVFIGIGSAAVLIGWLFGLLQFYSGRCIKARKYYMFSFIVAAINCLNVPLGTLLGVSTIIVLNRPAVKAKYEELGTNL